MCHKYAIWTILKRNRYGSDCKKIALVWVCQLKKPRLQVEWASIGTFALLEIFCLLKCLQEWRRERARAGFCHKIPRLLTYSPSLHLSLCLCFFSAEVFPDAIKQRDTKLDCCLPHLPALPAVLKWEVENLSDGCRGRKHSCTLSTWYWVLFSWFVVNNGLKWAANCIQVGADQLRSRYLCMTRSVGYTLGLVAYPPCSVSPASSILGKGEMSRLLLARPY